MSDHIESLAKDSDALATAISASSTPVIQRQYADEVVPESNRSSIPWPRFTDHSQKFLAICFLLVLLAAAGLLSRAWLATQVSAFGKFWAPLNKSSKPALIYCGGGFVYKLYDQFLDEYSLKHAQKYTRREFFVDLKPGESVPSQDLIPNKHFVPFGDLASTARVVTTLAGFKSPMIFVTEMISRLPSFALHQ